MRAQRHYSMQLTTFWMVDQPTMDLMLDRHMESPTNLA